MNWVVRQARTLKNKTEKIKETKKKEEEKRVNDLKEIEGNPAKPAKTRSVRRKEY